MSYIEDLMQFGLTRQESAIYYALLSEGMMTGYEAAKVSRRIQIKCIHGIGGTG